MFQSKVRRNVKVDEANDIVLTSPNRDKLHISTNVPTLKFRVAHVRADTKLNADVLFSDYQANNTKRCHPKLYRLYR